MFRRSTTELHCISAMAGLEPATSRLIGDNPILPALTSKLNIFNLTPAPKSCQVKSAPFRIYFTALVMEGLEGLEPPASKFVASRSESR